MTKTRTGRVLPASLQSGTRGLWANQDRMTALKADHPRDRGTYPTRRRRIEKPAAAPMNPPQPAKRFERKLEGLSDRGIEAAVRAIGQLTEGQQDRAVQALIANRLRSVNANRFITLKPASDSTDRMNQWMYPGPDDVKALNEAVVRWLTFVAKKVRGRATEGIPPDQWLDFAAVFENADERGNRTPLHVHVLLHVPQEKLAWFDDPKDGAAKQWPFAFKTDVPAAVIEPVTNNNRLSGYCSKNMWQAGSHDYVMLSQDLAKNIKK